MKKSKKFISWFANPKWYFLVPIMLVAVAATACGTIILTQEALSEYVIWGYVLLGVMAITLSYSVFGIIRIYPRAKERILKWAEKYPRVNKVFNQYGFTTLLFTTFSLIITTAFAVYNGSIAIVIRSIWFGALAAYYLVLMVLRGSILVYHGNRQKAVNKGQSEMRTLLNDGKLYLSCGIMLFLLPVCLSFAVMQMVRAGDSFEHKGITIYVYAVYAFYKIITAIYNFIKERKSQSMTIMAIKNITLADAFVSILALQTTMFREFGGLSSDLSTVTMNAITGAAVCAITIAIGIYMIVQASLRIKKLKQQPLIENDEQNVE